MKRSPFVILFVVVMLACSLFLIAYVPLSVSLRASLEDVTGSLETSRGRERKQLAEYNEVTSAIPLAREELSHIQPLADDASARSAELKAERKVLRAEKADLEEQLNSLTDKEKEAAE